MEKQTLFRSSNYYYWPPRAVLKTFWFNVLIMLDHEFSMTVDHVSEQFSYFVQGYCSEDQVKQIDNFVLQIVQSP